MRRLPIYFLIDVSESMVGKPIEYVQNGMRSIITELRTDPYALETAYISVIAFAGKAKLLSPLTEVTLFYPPKLAVGSGTSLGVALNYLMDEIDRSVKKTTIEEKGDWKPIVFLFTDGNPTDDYESAFARWNNKYKKHANLVIVSIGENADTQMLGRISENVLCLTKTDEISYKAFFKWVTDTIKTSSQSVSEGMGEDAVVEPNKSINLEKVDTSQKVIVDEHYVVLTGKCQETKKRYLAKYEKQGVYLDLGEEKYMKTDGYKLEGAYQIDEEVYDQLSDNSPTNLKINSSRLRGVPTCPCCGNQLGLVMCSCGNMFCAGDSPVNTCPWCGETVTIGVGEGGFDIERNRG